MAHAGPGRDRAASRPAPGALAEAGLRRWMDDLGPRLIALSAGICRDRHRAEEIVQEAFVKLWRQPPEAGEIAFPSWMRRVVVNASINALQRTKRPGMLPEHGDDRATHSREHVPGSEVAGRDELERVRRAMDRLDPMKRTILHLRAAEEMTYEQIAAHMDVPVGTVMSRLNRARTALSAELAAMAAEDEAADTQRAGTDEPERGAASYPIRRYLSA